MDLAISYSTPMRLLLGAAGVGPRHSRVVIGADDVEVRLGWGFRARLPRRSVVAARPWPPGKRRPVSRGAHGWRGRWLVNGSSAGLVVLSIDPPAEARALGFPVHLRELTVSVEEPDRLVGELAPVAR